MGRVPRIQSSDLHYHVIARCNNQRFYFENDEDFEIYLGILRTFKRKHGFRLFNYELMNSHVHLLLNPSSKISLGSTMHAINWSFANSYNKRKRRKGHFWMDRYKSIPVETDEHVLALMRYINRNAVRAGMVRQPGDWKWSGYRFYAFSEPNDLLDPHPTYLGLGHEEEFRRTAYHKFVCQILPEDDARDPQLSDSFYIGTESFGKRLGFERAL